MDLAKYRTSSLQSSLSELPVEDRPLGAPRPHDRRGRIRIHTPADDHPRSPYSAARRVARGQGRGRPTRDYLGGRGTQGPGPGQQGPASGGRFRTFGRPFGAVGADYGVSMRVSFGLDGCSRMSFGLDLPESGLSIMADGRSRNSPCPLETYPKTFDGV